MEEKEKKPETIYITEEELAAPPAPGVAPAMPGMPPPMAAPAVPVIRLCPSCQRQISPDTTFCQFCGYGPLRPTVSYEVKKKGTAALLAIVPALFGVCGIAHFYLEKLAIGFLFLIAGLIFYGTAWTLWWFYADLWLWAIVLWVAYVGVAIWQVFDAVAFAEEHYRVLETP